MGQLELWTFSIYWIIGALLMLIMVSVLLVVLWSVLKAWLWRSQQRIDQEKYHKQTHRADGRKYPPFAQGVCEKCGRISKRIYYPETGPKLCSDCYEKHWRQEVWDKMQEQGSIDSGSD